MARKRKFSTDRHVSAFVCFLAVAVFGSACSDGSGPTSNTATETTPTAPPRPAGPAAELHELSGGNGVGLGSPTKVDLAGTGYVETEYAASGTATSYDPRGALGADGRWTFQPGTTAPYTTRVLVRRPAADKFSGTVVVEWLNVSSGTDSDVVWSSTHEELMRQGDAWVGVSAQRIGVMGGPALTPTGGGSATAGGLVNTDSARYGSLNQPGDGYSFDIFTQAARGVRAGGVAMGDLKPQHVLAAGQSQSAYALVTYLNGVQPLTREFDGFLVHSRGSGGLPLVAPGEPASLGSETATSPVIIRADTDVPVLEVQAEGDLRAPLNSVVSRQPDSGQFRLWEVAGAAHADAHTVGPFADALGCGAINNAPMHVVVKAALHALEEWVSEGTLPATAPRLEVTQNSPPQVARDADGIARGGVRTPPVDVPVDVLSGTPGPNPSVICSLFGSTTPLPAERLTALYSSSDAYLQKYTTAADSTIKAGFVLPADRDALLAYAQPTRIQ
ncbi:MULTISPECIES: alpha/beta hydrolase domain-containing protein [unclassified Parafrankia]|uniref:alpha/beta hydrolase domain-containing protein n=1 Tax=unclassified Parafrankia TaxID=2994368 RepID=UPI000DD48689|nr:MULTISPECIES: alpha/beta hydrolase domain-containing protein [unclassified Parafrankia]TCJ33719.1 hypothetical protein E0504_36435 [Parafrankia sp. BMG5.11]